MVDAFLVNTMPDNKIRPLLRRKNAAIMGILNATPDSFSDGGQFTSVDAAVRHALTMVEEGADILDIGGESTRPGADKVSVQQELDRVVPVIEKLRQITDTPISIDTYKPQVMQAAVRAGAQMINDVNALRAEGATALVSELGVPVCLMHMLKQPKTMQASPDYEDVVTEVIGFLNERRSACEAEGINAADIIIDPGIGFGKTLQHNLLLLKSVERLKVDTNCEVLIGVSRKSLIEKQLGRSVDERMPASLGLAVQSVLAGAKIIRVHDVRATHDAIKMVEAVRDVSGGS